MIRYVNHATSNSSPFFDPLKRAKQKHKHACQIAFFKDLEIEHV